MSFPGSLPTRSNAAAGSAAPASGVRAWWRQARQTIRTWSQRTAERHQLWDLSDNDLRDMGVSRLDAIAEASKPFWRE